MKIKSICEITGLSDRTIRFYIEQKLILPSYTENYLGRKTFDFSQKDIEDLNDIAILRKFDFTIEEIRDIINDAETSKDILCNVRKRTEKTILNGQEKLSVLSRMSTDKVYTLAELAKELSRPFWIFPDRREIIKKDISKTIFTALKTALIFAIVWLPVTLSLFVIATSINNYHYPVFNTKMIALTIISFFPSIAVLIISKIKLSWKKIAKRILLVLCVLSIPMSFFLSCGIISKSETTDFKNYRNFDVNCLANRNIVFQEFFPDWPHYLENVRQPDGSYKTVYLDSNYYYHYYKCFDYTYDIYAEWPLKETDLLKR